MFFFGSIAELQGCCCKRSEQWQTCIFYDLVKCYNLKCAFVAPTTVNQRYAVTGIYYHFNLQSTFWSLENSTLDCPRAIHVF